MLGREENKVEIYKKKLQNQYSRESMKNSDTKWNKNNVICTEARILLKLFFIVT